MAEIKDYEQFELKCFNGIIGKEIDLSYKESGNCVCKFSIPLSEGKDKPTVWLNAVAFGDIAEQIGEKYKKSSYITIFGNFSISKYNDKEYISFIVKKFI